MSEQGPLVLCARNVQHEDVESVDKDRLEADD